VWVQSWKDFKLSAQAETNHGCDVIRVGGRLQLIGPRKKNNQSFYHLDTT